MIQKISILVSSDHMILFQNSFSIPIWSHENFKRLATCFLLSIGVWRGWKLFMLLLCSPLLMVRLLTEVPAASRSFLNSFRVIIRLFFTFLSKIQLPQALIFRGAPDRAKLVVVPCCLNLRLMESTVAYGTFISAEIFL